MTSDSIKSSFSSATRSSNLVKLNEEQFDLVVVGAGITGAGIARDASMRGMKTALIDSADFGSGTSSRSSRLIHGGLRYLEMGDLRLVFEASRERRNLLKVAPHLVWPRSFIFPIHSGNRVNRPKLAAGLWLYDILALFNNVQSHRMLSKRSLLKTEPGIRETGLKGGARYYDAQCDDTRLTLANVRSAHTNGAVCANYVELNDFDIADGRLQGVKASDKLTGTKLTIRGKVVINATGPWSDRIRSKVGGKPALRLTKGAHIGVPRSRVGNNEAITMISPLDGRVMFVIPWEDLTYVGTTDTDDISDPGQVRASAADVIYLLRSANSMFPNARLQPDDVVTAWAGLRPLLKPSDPKDPSSVSREHRIIEDESGLLSIVGGKLTTYRAMAAEIVGVAAKRIKRREGTSFRSRRNTSVEPLPGGEIRDTESIVSTLSGEGLREDIARSMVRRHGTEALVIARGASTNPQQRKPICSEHPSIVAELHHTVANEMPMTLTDILNRRIHVGRDVPGLGEETVRFVAGTVATDLGWSEGDVEQQVTSFLEEREARMSFLNYV